MPEPTGQIRQPPFPACRPARPDACIPGLRPLFRIPDGLRQNDFPVFVKVERFRTGIPVEPSTHDRCQPLGGAEQVHILAYEPDIGTGVEFTIVFRSFHFPEVGDIDKVKRRGGGKCLNAGFFAEISGGNRFEQ